MSRVIKFRAWDKGFNRMLMGVGVHPHICCIHDNYRKGEIGSYTISPEFVSYELMQFTGITDRNGVEIYEGDVLKFDGSIIGAVTFEAAEFIVGKGVNARALCAIAHIADEVLEIIGNIYENPELLEAKP